MWFVSKSGKPLTPWFGFGVPLSQPSTIGHHRNTETLICSKDVPLAVIERLELVCQGNWQLAEEADVEQG